jgi:hypothetical protein
LCILKDTALERSLDEVVEEYPMKLRPETIKIYPYIKKILKDIAD